LRPFSWCRVSDHYRGGRDNGAEGIRFPGSVERRFQVVDGFAGLNLCRALPCAAFDSKELEKQCDV
jgi:hypothetical protein